MRIAALALLLLLQDPPKPWIGVSMTLESNIPKAEGVSAKAAIRVADLPASSPALKAGVKTGDLIVGIDGRDWDVDAKEIINAFRSAVGGRKVGDVVALRIVRDEIEGMPAGPIEEEVRKRGELTLRHKVSLLEVKVTLEARPADAMAQKKIPEKPDFEPKAWPEEALAKSLVEEKKLGDAYADLRARLAKLHASADAFRLTSVAHVHRHPWQLRTCVRRERVDIEWPGPLAPERPVIPQDFNDLLTHVKTIRELRDEAFKPLSADEMKFLDANIDSLASRFAEHIYLDSDPDKERYARHVKVLNLVTRVDYSKLAAAQLRFAWVLRGLETVRADLTKEWAAKGKPEGVFYEKDGVVVSGHGTTWHRTKADVIIDLGGNDFYSNPPAIVQIDYGGDDAYEATGPWAQGAGRLGISCLVDVAGNDSYIGTRWAQGAAILGVGMLVDQAGDDTYRGDTFCQGVGLWGLGLLHDASGRDRYDAHYMSQGVGLPGGSGVLRDDSGDDHYYAKGTKPTNYGDAGIFDAWSQGCGLGFRQHASGGVGMLEDSAGNDVYEAGNFSQGGGYYFGVGEMRDFAGDDRYIGSRYNQGFAAHQAVGFFEDLKGNDHYTTRQGVAQGLAWDECVTVFVDHEGDDTYEGGAFFSQGASAHNSIAVFLDLAGKDRYRYPQQAAAGGNDYHGGTSLSLFIDAGGAADEYAGADRNNAIFFSGEHGFACDLPGSIEDVLKDGAFRKLLR
jgi:hypothetical protein